MATTFFEYLTLPNPETDASRCKKGPNTKSTSNYGPNKVRPWTDITLKNLEASFGDVLLQQMDKPLIKDSKDVPLEKGILYEEDSITMLAASWTEPVVQHALSGTQKVLSDSQPDGPFTRGKIYFLKNTGRGHVKNEKGKDQKPDWCVYQKGQVEGDGELVANLVPGDTKPARKWKSAWINSTDETTRRRAKLVLQQITKYMYLGNTRYGFILSEEELVPVRLSKYLRGPGRDDEKRTDNRDQQILRSNWETINDDQEDDGVISDITQDGERDTDGSFAESSRPFGLLLEYGCVPWGANGRGDLTINLTLWWLPVLAVQCALIKESGSYTPLSEKKRGHSPEPDRRLSDGGKKLIIGKTSSRSRKRRLSDSQSSKKVAGRPKIQQPDEVVDREGNESGISTRTRSALRSSSNREDEDQAPSNAFVNRPIVERRPLSTRRQSKRQKRRTTPNQSDYSADDSSQATNDYQFSFTRSFSRF